MPEAVRQQVRHAAFSGPSAESFGLRPGTICYAWESKAPLAPAVRGNAAGASDAAAETARRKLRGSRSLRIRGAGDQALAGAAPAFRHGGPPRLLIGAAALVVLPLLLLLSARKWKAASRRDGTDMSTEVAELDGIQQKIHQFRPWFEPAPAGAPTHGKPGPAFPDQGDVWAKSIQVAEGHKVTCTGFARTQPALMTLLGHLRARPDITALRCSKSAAKTQSSFPSPTNGSRNMTDSQRLKYLKIGAIGLVGLLLLDRVVISPAMGAGPPRTSGSTRSSKRSSAAGNCSNARTSSGRAGPICCGQICQRKFPPRRTRRFNPSDAGSTPAASVSPA